MTSYLDHGDGPALICLHGVGGGKEIWSRQTDAVVAAGWRMVAVDAPGVGTTPMAPAIGFGPHVDAVLRVMDRLGIETAALCGHSLGGMTAQEIYALHPDRVDALVLSATSPAFGRPDGEFQAQFLRERLEPFERGVTMAEFAARSAGKLLGPDPPDGVEQEVAAAIAATPKAAYVVGWRTITTFDRRANLPNIKVPCLLISGEHDRNSPPQMVEKMASKIPGAEYVMLPDVGHMALMEDADAFNATLTDFLKRIAR